VPENPQSINRLASTLQIPASSSPAALLDSKPSRSEASTFSGIATDFVQEAAEWSVLYAKEVSEPG
jgi:hypothetical protein